MTEQELRSRLENLAGEIPAETHRAFLSAASPGKEAKVMKKKISAGLVFALVLLLLAVAAIAAGIGYNLEWWYTERNGEVDPAAVQAMMDHRVENPEQQQAEDSLVNVSIREISLVPESGILDVLIQASVKDPEHFELHSSYALDVDGSYMGPGGDPDPEEDGEDRGVHWMWVSDPTGEEESRIGPVLQVMDDNTKRLLLIECTGVTSPEGEHVLGYPSLDEFRTPEGEVVYVLEYSPEWISTEYDRQQEAFGKEYPNMKEYADGKIAEAQAAREKLAEGIPCVLQYRVVEYTEGMDDEVLYTGGTTGQVEFAVRLTEGGN